jgi:hypothetical protein
LHLVTDPSGPTFRPVEHSAAAAAYCLRFACTASRRDRSAGIAPHSVPRCGSDHTARADWATISHSTVVHHAPAERRPILAEPMGMADRAGERVPNQCDQIALGNAHRLFHEAKAGTKPPGAKITKPRRSLWSRMAGASNGWVLPLALPSMGDRGLADDRQHPFETAKAYLCPYAVTSTML